MNNAEIMFSVIIMLYIHTFRYTIKAQRTGKGTIRTISAVKKNHRNRRKLLLGKNESA